MKKNNILIVLAGIVGVLLLLALPTCSAYNGMVAMRNEVKAKSDEIQNQYQRRFDLIPNLVETVKGYAKHEQSTLQGVTDARAGVAPVDTSAVMNAANAALNAPDANAYANAVGNLRREFSIYVNAVHEAYPDLKANENFSRLQDELAGTENRVEKARHDYIDAVKTYNTKIERFPASIVAGLFGFQPFDGFQAAPEAQSSPKITF